MASSYIQLGPTQFLPTNIFRRDTHHTDEDIARDARILKERMMYEERKMDELFEDKDCIDERISA
jgi:hypothetical protein